MDSLIKMNKNMLLHMIDFVKQDKGNDYGPKVSKLLNHEFSNRVDQYIISELPKYNNYILYSSLEIEKAYIITISKILDSICNELNNYILSNDIEHIEFLNQYEESEEYLDKFLCTNFN